MNFFFQNKIASVLLIVVSTFTIVACKKPGTGGNAKLNVRVFTKNYAVIGKKVYIKYGAKTSPGTEPGKYDANAVTDSTGKVVFNGLTKGDYFFYCAYTDSISNKNYQGENTILIDNSRGERDLVVKVDTIL